MATDEGKSGSGVEDRLDRLERRMEEIASMLEALQITRSAAPAGQPGLFPSPGPRTRAPASQPGSAPQSPAAGPQEVVIFCDGACEGNPGPGGWACIVENAGEREELSGGRDRTTNNQMELQALIEGLKLASAGARVRIVTDSEYLTKGVTSWMNGWMRNGWMTSTKQPVKNQEQWQQIAELLRDRSYRAEWVRGHNGHPENERCDELARTAIRAARKASR